MNKDKFIFYCLSFLLLYWILLWPAFIQSQTEEKFKITITEPARDGIEVGAQMDVKGTAIIPSGQYLWVLAHRAKGFKKVWWPQGEGEIDPRTNECKVRVTFGGAQDIGYELEIAVITVNEKEHRILENYWMNAMESGDWRPMRMPPTTFPPFIRVVKKISHD